MLAVAVGLPAGFAIWVAAWAVTSGVCAVPILGGWFCAGPGGLPPPTFGFEPLASLVLLLIGGVYVAHEWFEGRV